DQGKPVRERLERDHPESFVDGRQTEYAGACIKRAEPRGKDRSKKLDRSRPICRILERRRYVAAYDEAPPLVTPLAEARQQVGKTLPQKTIADRQHDVFSRLRAQRRDRKIPTERVQANLGSQLGLRVAVRAIPRGSHDDV